MNLGSWHAWSDDHKTMLFQNGESCWQGPSRSARVKVYCGSENVVISVDEPERCVYAFEFRSPAACSHEDVASLEEQLKQSEPTVRDDEL